MTEFLTYSDETFAVPAFRILLWCDGSLNDPTIAAAGAGLMDLFLRAFGPEATYLMQSGRGFKSRTVENTPEDAAKARDWLLTPPHKFATSLRFSAYLGEPHNLAAPPSFRLEEGAGMVLLEIDLPEQSDKIREFADRVTDLIAPLPVICGVMGFGFTLPTTHDSLIFNLPKPTLRYRAAVQIQLSGPVPGIRKERSFYPYDRHPEVEPGLADIGWRTIIGAAFAARLGDLSELANVPGVTVRNLGEQVVIDAGPAPIWGDMNKGEDISGYQAVAAALHDLRYPVKVARGSLFGDAEGDGDRLDRLDTYLTRFESSDDEL